MINIQVYYSNGATKLQYATVGSSGLDLRYPSKDPLIIRAKDTTPVKTGVYLIIPQGCEGQIRSKSGLALKGLLVANSPGTIDSDYRGEIIVILRNISNTDWVIRFNDRIAQLVFAPIIQPKLTEIKDYADFQSHAPTRRGIGGLGSTGV